jgi:hypothetical protein
MAQDDNNLQPFACSFGKPVLHGLGLDKVFGGKMQRLSLLHNSTRLSSKPFFFMEARLGSSLGLPWHSSRDFTSAWPTEWQTRTSQSAALGVSGSTQGWRMF